MRRMVWKSCFVIALVAMAWSIGRAQGAVADFESSVDAPAGTVVMTCHRGCDWMTLTSDAVDRSTGSAIPNTAGPQKFVYGCTGSNRCKGTVNGLGFVRR